MRGTIEVLFGISFFATWLSAVFAWISVAIRYVKACGGWRRSPIPERGERPTTWPEKYKAQDRHLLIVLKTAGSYFNTRRGLINACVFTVGVIGMAVFGLWYLAETRDERRAPARPRPDVFGYSSISRSIGTRTASDDATIPASAADRSSLSRTAIRSGSTPAATATS